MSNVCSTEYRKELIEKYTEVFQGIGYTVEEAQLRAEARVSSVETPTKFVHQAFRDIRNTAALQISKNHKYTVQYSGVFAAQVFLKRQKTYADTFDLLDLYKNEGILSKEDYVELAGTTWRGTYFSDVQNIVLPDYFKLLQDQDKEGSISHMLIKEYGASAMDLSEFVKTIVDEQIEEQVKAHEMNHAGTVKFIDKNPNDKDVQSLNGLFNILQRIDKKRPDLKLSEINNGYWKKDVKEFVAEVMSKDQLMIRLTGIDINGRDIKEGGESYFKRLMGILYSIINKALPKNEGLSFYEHVLGVNNSITSRLDNPTNNEYAEPSSEGLYSSGYSNDNLIWDNSILDVNNIMDVFEDLESKGNVTDSYDHKQELKQVIAEAQRLIPDTTKFVLEKAKDKSTWGSIVNQTLKLAIADSTEPLIDTSQMSAQETFAHEITHAFSRFGIENNSTLSRQIRRLHAIAKKHIKPRDLIRKDKNGNYIVHTTMKDELKAAQARWDYIFNHPNGIHEFAAYGKTNEAFKKAISKLDARDIVPNSDGTLLGAISAWFTNLINMFQDKLNGINDMKMDVALNHLIYKISQTSTSTKKLETKYSDVVEKADQYAVDIAVNKLIEPIRKFANSNPNSASKLKKGIQAVDNMFNDAGREAYVKGLRRVAKAVGMYKDVFILNLIRKLPRELGGFSKEMFIYDKLIRISKNTVDKARTHANNITKKSVKNGFLTSFSEAESVSMHYGILKTSLIDLIDEAGTYTWDDVRKVYKDQAYRQSLIAKHEQAMSAYGVNAADYLRQAKGLANLMLFSEGFTKNQMQNPHNIAQGYYSLKFVPVGDLNKAEENINVLKTLYAIDLLDPTHLTRMNEVMDREFGKSKTNNGIIHAVGLYRHFIKEYRSKVFTDERFVSGYTPEITDPRKSIIRVPETDIEEYKNRGYRVLHELTKSTSDPSSVKYHLMVADYMGLTTYLKSAMSLTNYKDEYDRTGSTLRDIYNSMGSHVSTQEARDKATEEMKKGTDMLPILNSQGKPIDLRYVFPENERISLMNKTTKLEYSMGKMSEYLVDLVNTSEINAKIAEVLQDDYNENYSKDPGAFVHIHRLSNDKKIKEIYAHMREHINMEGLYVREEVLDFVFGYRKYSLGDKEVFRNNKWISANTVKYIESIWQEIVSGAKTNIVLKTTVLPLNIVSNIMLLKMYGVPITKIFRLKSKAISDINSYMAAVNEVDTLKLDLAANPNLTKIEKNRIQGRINQLQQDIDSNPVKKLVEDEGMFSSIVEDINLEEEELYTDRSTLVHKIQTKADKVVPKQVQEVYQQLYITKNTRMYKFLMNATKYSDFVAKYTLYTHLKDRGKLSEEEIVKTVVESFINYDVPTSKELQYLNDMGMFIFTKFAIRIQKIIYQLFAKKPASTLSYLFLESILGNFVDINDSIAFVPGINNLPAFLVDGYAMPALATVDRYVL